MLVEAARDRRERLALGAGIGIQEQKHVTRRDVRSLIGCRTESAVVLVDQNRGAGPEGEDLRAATAVLYDDERNTRAVAGDSTHDRRSSTSFQDTRITVISRTAVAESLVPGPWSLVVRVNVDGILKD